MPAITVLLELTIIALRFHPPQPSPAEQRPMYPRVLPTESPEPEYVLHTCRMHVYKEKYISYPTMPGVVEGVKTLAPDANNV